jgi:hypothetical protein
LTAPVLDAIAASELAEVEDMVESVRWRSWFDHVEMADAGTGIVATERAEEMDVRRSELLAREGDGSSGDAVISVRTLTGDASRLGGDPESCARGASDVMSGASGAGLLCAASRLSRPCECARMSGCGRSGASSRVTECVDGGRVMARRACACSAS